MLQKNKGKLILSSIIILLPVILGLLLWDRLPDKIPTHWGIDGTPNGWSSRAVAVLVMPLLLLALHWLCLFVTSKDEKNKGQSRKVFNLLFWLVPALSIFICGIIYAAALGRELQVSVLMTAFLGLIFVIVGNYLPKTKQNHTIGIKIKWTLEDEENWNATHRLVGKLWMVGGLLMIACTFLPEGIMTVMMPVTLGIMVGVPIVYSWWFCRKKKG